MQDGNDVAKEVKAPLHDQVDASRIVENEEEQSGFKKSSPTPGVAQMPVEKDSDTYNMEHPKRGVAYIFNHKTFESKDLLPRNRTDEDRDNLQKTLEGLDFEVKIFNDLAAREVQKVLEQAAMDDHGDEDCILVVVLSHGEMNRLHASDRPYNSDKIWTHFTADNCPSLAGKPKLFFIQACQGDQLDFGTKLTKNVVETDSHPQRTTQTDSTSMAYKIPSNADFLIVNSTIPGFYSWRNGLHGSWFVRALCQVLDEEGSTRDLLSMLTKVSRKVALDFQSKNYKNRQRTGMKQVPCITSRLIRDVYFPKKQTTA